MVTHPLHTFFAQVTEDIASEYRRIYAVAAEDPGTAGDEGEANWAHLFREWLPPQYHIETKGRLIGHDGTRSPQIDVVVLKPFYPRKLREKKIWLADGVAAAFECKNTLTAVHVADSVKRAVEFKKLPLPKGGTPATELRAPILYGVLAHSHNWKGEKSRPIENVQDALNTASQSIDHPRSLLDIMCVADLATWTRMTTTKYLASWAGPKSAELRAYFGGDWGVATSMMCASRQAESQSETFTPIGALIGFLTQALARSDESLRDLADYYRRANVWGTAAGLQRFWTSSVYSPKILQEIQQGRRFTNDGDWDDWGIALI